MSTSPSVSVIVAAFNQEKYIGRCLRSLLDQRMDNGSYEVIVINDGSTDRTGYALTQFCGPDKSPVRVITNKRNEGLPSALNTGIRHAHGDYIVRVDSDDFVNTNYLLFLHYYLVSNCDADAVSCDYLLVDDEERVIRRCSSKDEPIACGIMFRKKQMMDVGLYDESFLMNEERELRARFDRVFSMRYLDVPLYRYRMHGGNMTLKKKEMDYYLGRLVQKHGDDIDVEGTSDSRA